MLKPRRIHRGDLSGPHPQNEGVQTYPADYGEELWRENTQGGGQVHGNSACVCEISSAAEERVREGRGKERLPQSLSLNPDFFLFEIQLVPDGGLKSDSPETDSNSKIKRVSLRGG